MPRHDAARLNIRPEFAHTRVDEIAQRTSMTVTEVIEDAFRGCGPAAGPDQVGALVRRGPVLVWPASDSRRISLEAADAVLAAGRDREL